MSTTPDVRLLSPEEVCERLGIPMRTLTYWRESNLGPPWVRLGHRTIRYREDSLAEWVEAREAGA